MIIVILLLVRSSYAGDGRYECGPNGRFEYCIDDIPGCVVGCHCYPGYFFDTDTKICEPNTKLTHDFRRHYIIDSGKDGTTTQPAPATTAPPPDVAKENDDLSDWLYNQFFKTIENQVVNKTDDDDLPQKETRRSGGGPVIKRRFKKKRPRKGSKKSKKGLRRKLLRISEDDSMFDSESDYDSSSSSSSWENWSNGDSDAKSEKKKPKHGHDHNGDHRKIVVFSKKPKPPLPSFIFLPNIETPFYPPIGLPLPPLPAPMYPMVPIPPIQPPPQGGSTPGSIPGPAASTPAASAQPTPGKATPPTNDTNAGNSDGSTPETNEGSSDGSTPETNAGNSDGSTPETNAGISDGSTPETNPENSDGSTPETNPENPVVNPETNEGNPEGPAPEANAPQLRGGRTKMLGGRAKNQLLNRLKQRNKSQRNPKRKKVAHGQVLRTPGINPFLNPSFGIGEAVQQPILEDNANHEAGEVPPFNNEVDFNYLSQLIHRVDLNGTTPASPKMKINDNRNRLMELMNSGPMLLPPGLRRAPAGPRRSLGAPASQPDDSYYTKLGREIAKLIRDIHPDEHAGGEEHDNGDISSRFLGDDSFRSRSYWERFVRSPLKLRLDNFSKLGNLKSSNEKLFELENKAEVAAESSSVLSLPELENVINAMRKAQNQIQRHTYKIDNKYGNNKKPSNSSLNVSLLPRNNGKLINVQKKPLSKDTRTHIGNRRSLTINQDFRKNNLKSSNTSGVSTAGRKQMNHANNYYLPKQHVPDKHYKNNFRNNFHLTTTVPSIVNNNVKNTNQLQPAIVHSNYLNRYYNAYNNMMPNLATTVSEPYRPFIESKPSYFFNEFEFFI